MKVKTKKNEVILRHGHIALDGVREKFQIN